MNKEREREEHGEGFDFLEYLRILRRRRWYMILPLVAILATAVVVAVTLPPVYRSSATILIEQQQIPQDLARATVTGFADQRVQIISQRVLNSANLRRIIEQYDLYPELRQQEPMSAAVSIMRRDVSVRMVRAEGRGGQASIAFTVNFDHESPQVARRVVDEVVSLFLEENLRTRREAARETTVFLGAEAERLAEQIADLEVRVAEFKEQHGDRMPEMQQVNAQFLRRTEEQIGRQDLEIRLMEDRITLLEGELARTAQYGSGETGSRRGVTPRERLVELELQHLELSTRVTANHPDLVQLERQINTLRAQTGGLDQSQLEAMLVAARATLEERRSTLADSHPDVRSALQAVASLEDQLASVQRTAAAPVQQRAENPDFRRIRDQLVQARSELQHTRDKRRALEAELAAYEERVRAGPMIEREYRALTRDYESSLAQLREVRAKQMQAEIGQSLEEEGRAERFVLIEPASLPGSPIKPDRERIVFLGFILAFVGGGGLVALREVLAQAIYGSKAVAAITGAPPLAVVPYISTAEEIRRKWIKRFLGAVAILVILVGALAAVHLHVTPLDLATIELLERIGLSDLGTRLWGGD